MGQRGVENSQWSYTAGMFNAEFIIPSVPGVDTYTIFRLRICSSRRVYHPANRFRMHASCVEQDESSLLKLSRYCSEGAWALSLNHGTAHENTAGHETKSEPLRTYLTCSPMRNAYHLYTWRVSTAEMLPCSTYRVCIQRRIVG